MLLNRGVTLALILSFVASAPAAARMTIAPEMLTKMLLKNIPDVPPNGTTCTTGFASCAERDEHRKKAAQDFAAYQQSLIFNYLNNNRCQKKTTNNLWKPQVHDLCRQSPQPAIAPDPIPVQTGTMPINTEIVAAAECDLSQVTMSTKARLQDLRAAMLMSARQRIKQVQEKRQADLDAMEALFKEHGIKRSLSRIEILQMAEVFQSHTLNALKKFDKPEVDEKYQEDLKGWFRDFVAPKIQKIKADIANNALPPARRNDEERFEFFMTRAREEDKGTYKKPFSPYVARMVLMSLLETRLRKEKPNEADKILDDFAAKLHLKYEASGKGWSGIILHDGYVYGAINEDAERLFGGSPDGSKGIDCSLFLQKTLESLMFCDKSFIDANDRSIRTDTKIILTQGLEQVPMRRVCSEKELVPGDVIVKQGHTYTFSGYAGDPLQMQVIEAAGEESRTIREASLDIYKDSNCRTSEFTEKPHFVLDFEQVLK